MKILFILLVLVSCGKGGGSPEATTASCKEKETCITGNYGATDGDFSAEYTFTEDLLEVCAHDDVEGEFACATSRYTIEDGVIYADGFTGDCVKDGAPKAFAIERPDDNSMIICFSNKQADCYDFEKRDFDKSKKLKSYSVDCKLVDL